MIRDAVCLFGLVGGYCLCCCVAYLFSVLMVLIDWFGLVLRYLLLYLGLVCYLCYSVVWYLGWVVFVSSGLCFGVFGAFLVCC